MGIFQGLPSSFFFKKCLFFWPHWIFIAVCRLCLVVGCLGYSLVAVLSYCSGFLLRSTGSVVTAYGLSCPEARRLSLDQWSNRCPLHWQADS